MALGEGPKVFMLAEATLFIRIAPSRGHIAPLCDFLSRVGALDNLIFLLLLFWDLFYR